MVFPIFFNLSLNFARRSSWSEPQSAPVLVFAACVELGQAYRTSMCRPRIWTQVCVNQTPSSYHSFSSLPLIVPCWWEWQAYDAPVLTWGWTSEWELGEMGCHVTCQRLACSFFLEERYLVIPGSTEWRLGPSFWTYFAFLLFHDSGCSSLVI